MSLRCLHSTLALAALIAACESKLDDAAMDASNSVDASSALDAAAAQDATVPRDDASFAQDSGGALWRAQEVAIEPDGRTPLLTFTLAQFERPTFALRAYSDDPSHRRTLCYQLEEVRADATSWVPKSTSADYGDYCMRCTQRVAVGAGYGFFVLPSGVAEPASFARIELRVALRDCLTLSPLSPSAPRPRTLTVESAHFRAPARDERLLLPVVMVTATPYAFSEDAARLDAVFERVRTIWAAAGIELSLHAAFELPRPAAPVVYSALDRAALSELARAAAPRVRQAGVHASVPHIFVTPCLIREDLLRSGRSEPLATTTHVPGGQALPDDPDGIFIAGERCGGLTPGTRYVERESMAAVIAHELGHYLGLFHVREADGREDALADTSDEQPNLMRSQPSARAIAISDSQIEIARRHAALAASPQK